MRDESTAPATPVQLTSEEQACIEHIRGQLRTWLPPAIGLARGLSDRYSRPERREQGRQLATDLAVNGVVNDIIARSEFSNVFGIQVPTACYGRDVRIECESVPPHENLPRCIIQAPPYRTYRFP
jgi:methyl coenzyme M reductase subunit C-like uncharacterized protein (methanogenesis marker protein 7)